jgi:hypothetical protein
MLSIFNHSDDEEEIPTVDVAPRTSTSHTLLASDTLVEGEESSPPQRDVVTTTPPSSPLAPSPKRTRIETITEPAPQLGSSSTLLLDDVSFFIFLPLSIFPLFCFFTPSLCFHTGISLSLFFFDSP